MRRSLARRHRSGYSRRLLCGFESLETRSLLAADLVIDWNNAVIEAQRTDTMVWPVPHTGPGWSARNFALVHLAMFDALNAITQNYSSFALQQVAPAGASVEAAIATAAYDTLIALYPLSAAIFDPLLAQTLSSVPDGQSEDDGIAIGHLAAQMILDLRANDGAEATGNYQPSDEPGHWRSDPLNPGQTALGPAWGQVTPFGMLDPDLFQVPPPPPMTSAAYAAAFNDVKSLGELNSTTRTADQTEIGLFWAYDRPGFGPPTVLYNENVQDIAMQQGNSLEENARLFALVNLALADTSVVVWNTKYVYDFWRPIEGIRRASEDGNPHTVADPNWVPLGAPGPDPNSSTDDFTPPFPAYTSGHAGFGAATFKMLAHFFNFDYEDNDSQHPDQYDFQLSSDEFKPARTRSFESFSQAAEENGRSRIYLGIHWEFDNQFSQQQGRAVADDIFQTFLLPRDGHMMLSIQHDGSGMRTLALPEGADIVLRKIGQELWFINQDTNRVIAKETLSHMQSIQIDARNGAANRVILDLTTGKISSDVAIQILGGEDEGDAFEVKGSPLNDVLCLDGDVFTCGNSPLQVHLVGIMQVMLKGGAGNDTLKVLGDQTGRQITLNGEAGNDCYVIASEGGEISVIDSVGLDKLDFSGATGPLVLDASLNQGQPQAGGAGNTLRLFGEVENLIGTPLADEIFGGSKGSSVWGRDGDDLIRGGGGNDNLYGEGGDDWLYGDAGADCLLGGTGNDALNGGGGNDKLVGEAGFDLVLGGLGVDTIDAKSGDDLVISGRTAFDNYHDALLAILAEWASGRPLPTRIANLTDGSGSTDRENEDFFLTTGPGGTTLSDGDILFIGATNNNWLRTQPLDVILRR